MFQTCSLNHKIPLKELRHSLKCFEEDKVPTSSLDNLADGDTDKGEEAWSSRIFLWSLCAAHCCPVRRSCRDCISLLWTGRVLCWYTAGTYYCSSAQIT